MYIKQQSLVINTTTKRSIEVKERKRIPINCKQEIVELYKQGYSHQDIANKYKLGRSTVTKIIGAQRITNNKDIKLERKHIVEAKITSIENLLLSFYCEKFSLDSEIEYLVKRGVSQTDLIDAAKKFAIQIEAKNFKATNGWFNRFRKKYNMVFQTNEKETIKPVNNINNALLSDNLENFSNIYQQQYLSSVNIHNEMSLNNDVQFIPYGYPFALPPSPASNQYSNLYDTNQNNLQNVDLYANNAYNCPNHPIQFNPNYYCSVNSQKNYHF